jgi:hypothetical protein
VDARHWTVAGGAPQSLLVRRLARLRLAAARRRQGQAGAARGGCVRFREGLPASAGAPRPPARQAPGLGAAGGLEGPEMLRPACDPRGIGVRPGAPGWGRWRAFARRPRGLSSGA